MPTKYGKGVISSPLKQLLSQLKTQGGSALRKDGRWIWPITAEVKQGEGREAECKDHDIEINVKTERVRKRKESKDKRDDQRVTQKLHTIRKMRMANGITLINEAGLRESINQWRVVSPVQIHILFQLEVPEESEQFNISVEGDTRKTNQS